MKKDLLIEFIDKYLSGNIENLKTFCFEDLEDDTFFGCPGNFDCDNTYIAKIIFVLVWGDILPDISIEKIGTGKLYRGDTLNSFNTIFGKEDPCNRGNYYQLSRFSLDDNFIEHVRNFHRTYHTVGNFLPLPNITMSDISRSPTLNTYRGRTWKDFFDRFLIELDKCIENNIEKNASLSILVDRNAFFFDWLKANGGIDFFKKIYYLEPYFENDKIKHLFPQEFSWKPSGTVSPEETTAYYFTASNYIEISEQIIDYRATKIISKLKKILTNS